MFLNALDRIVKSGYMPVYIDESGSVKNSLRAHGYEDKCIRCKGLHDWQGKNIVQAIGALCQKTLLTVSLITGTVNGSVFKAWLDQDLLPKLTSLCVLIMNNATFHKVKGVRGMIEEQGPLLLYLSPYSSELNPLEQKWSQVESIRNRIRANDIGSLFRDHITWPFYIFFAIE